MMRLHRLLLCVVLTLQGPLFAQLPTKGNEANQSSKPLLFSALPDSFEVDRPQLQKLFAANINENISLQLSSQFSINGVLVDKNQHNAGSLTINIRLANYKNALFNLSLRLLADNSTSIQGRILHPRYSDILILYKEKDRYFMKKTSQKLYMPE